MAIDERYSGLVESDIYKKNGHYHMDSIIGLPLWHMRPAREVAGFIDDNFNGLVEVHDFADDKYVDAASTIKLSALDVNVRGGLFFRIESRYSGAKEFFRSLDVKLQGVMILQKIYKDQQDRKDARIASSKRLIASGNIDDVVVDLLRQSEDYS